MTNPTGRPPVVDLATWQAARDELLVREKAHTREGDAIAAARRRLPMVEVDGTVRVVGAAGPVPFLDLFQGRDELVVGARAQLVGERCGVQGGRDLAGETNNTQQHGRSGQPVNKPAHRNLLHPGSYEGHALSCDEETVVPGSQRTQ